MEFVKKYGRDNKCRDAQFGRLIPVTNYIKNKGVLKKSKIRC